MDSVDPRQTGRADKAASRRRWAGGPLEALEERQLLSWSPLYQSLPDLAVSGYAAPVAAYEAPMAVTVEIRNLGANTFPLYDQQAGAPSTADSLPSTVIVYASAGKHYSPRTAVEIGRFDIPSIKENSLAVFNEEVTLPRGTGKLPADGNTVYLYFRVVTPRRPIPDFDLSNNLTRRGVPVQTAPALPDLFGYSLDVPPTLQPGATILPTIQVVNYGTVDPSSQGPFDVALVASDDEFFGPGDIILARSTIESVPPLALVPMRNAVLGDVNIDTPLNVVTITSSSPITLPPSPADYFLGVVVDPENVIREISEIGQGADPALNPVVGVGPRLHAFPPAGVVFDPPDPPFPFPYPPEGAIPPPETVPDVTGGTGGSTTTLPVFVIDSRQRQGQAVDATPTLQNLPVVQTIGTRIRRPSFRIKR